MFKKNTLKTVINEVPNKAFYNHLKLFIKEVEIKLMSDEKWIGDYGFDLILSKNIIHGYVM